MDPRRERRFRDDDNDGVFTDHLAQGGETLLGRLGDGDDDAAVLDARRHRLEPLGVLARESRKRVGVEPDRGTVDVAEVPLLGEQAGDVLFRGEALADDDLAEPLTRLAAHLQRRVELRVVEEPLGDEQLSERDTLDLRRFIGRRKLTGGGGVGHHSGQARVHIDIRPLSLSAQYAASP